MIRLYESVAEARSEVLGKRSPASVALPPPVKARIREVFGADLSAAEVVQRVLDDVRDHGDEAVRRYTKAFDGADIGDLMVGDAELDAALGSISPDVRDALETAAERIRAFHERSKRNSWLEFANGGALGQMIVPIERVGVYAPGGRAVYPSTVLMAAVPARVAGVSDVVLTSPPGPDGKLNHLVLAAARLAGVDRVYRIGGAQAIAALAFGTETVRRVDKIVGPGNLFVVLAKQAVSGNVGLDGLPGPTETVVVADRSANPRWIGWDMMAQAEHDPLAQSVVICVGRDVAESVVAELEELLPQVPREETIRASFAARGAVVVASSVDEAIGLANDHAPEHLCLAIADAWEHIGKVRNAGGVFVGEYSVEAVGDYTAGPSHIMPTSGTARFASPLNLDDFIKVISVFSFGTGELRSLGEPAMTLARAEGLTAHAGAIAARLASLDGGAGG